MSGVRRRLQPSITQPDWLVLRGLQHCIERWIATQALPAGSRVLDLGCGDRPYEPLFGRAGWSYHGADLGAAAEIPIEEGRPLPVDAHSFDAVVSFQVLEHVWDLDGYVGHVHHALRPGGRVLLSTHGSWMYHPHPTDFRRWTRDGLVRELQQRGLRVHDVRSLVGPLAWSLGLRAIAADHLLQRAGAPGRAAAMLACSVYNLRALAEDALTPADVRDHNACVYVCDCSAA